MKNKFAIYFQPSADQMKRIWDEAVIIVDANVLLNLYRYTTDTTTTFTGIIDKLSNRIWIPHQVALEYNANRITVINEQSDAYHRVQQTIKNAATEFNSKLEKELNKYKKRHPVINQSHITKKINDCIESILSELENNKKDQPNYVYDDPIRDFIVKHLGDKIGDPYDQKELDAIFKEGEERYAKKFPPGYEDLDEKAGEMRYYNELKIKNEYGDLIVWKQILDHAKTVDRPVIFVTDDAKEDWWQRNQGKTVGPRVELLNEFKYCTGRDFYMYESHRFIEYGQTYLSEQVNKAAVKEVEQYLIEKENKLTLDYNLDNNTGKKFKYHFKKMEFTTDEMKKILNLINNSSIVKEDLNNENTPKFKLHDFVNHRKYGVGRVVGDRDEEGRFLIYFNALNDARLIHESSPFLNNVDIDDL